MMKKFLALMFASALVVAAGCSKGHEAASADEGEDDQAEQKAAAASTAAAGAGGAAAPAAAPVSADAATLTGMVKFEGTAPKAAAIQMSADPYCQSQHAGGQGAQDEEVVVGATG